MYYDPDAKSVRVEPKERPKAEFSQFPIIAFGETNRRVLDSPVPKGKCTAAIYDEISYNEPVWRPCLLSLSKEEEKAEFCEIHTQMSQLKSENKRPIRFNTLLDTIGKFNARFTAISYDKLVKTISNNDIFLEKSQRRIGGNVKSIYNKEHDIAKKMISLQRELVNIQNQLNQQYGTKDAELVQVNTQLMTVEAELQKYIDFSQNLKNIIAVSSSASMENFETRKQTLDELYELSRKLIRENKLNEVEQNLLQNSNEADNRNIFLIFTSVMADPGRQEYLSDEDREKIVSFIASNNDIAEYVDKRIEEVLNQSRQSRQVMDQSR